MVTTVDAVYEDGVLRLLSPVELEDGACVRVTLEQDTPGNARYAALTVEERQQHMREFLDSVDALPREGTSGPTDSVDHDEILYRQYHERHGP